MDYIEKIKKLYHLSDDGLSGNNNDNGFSQDDMITLEHKLGVTLPKEFKRYYQTLGKNQAINQSHNCLANPNEDIELSDDGYLIFYRENQWVVLWGIKKADLSQDNPAVWGNFGSSDEPASEEPSWYIENTQLDKFLLTMAIYNGVSGGLTYHGHYFADDDNPISPDIVALIEKHWQKIADISDDKQAYYSNAFNDVISIIFNNEFDDQFNNTGQATALFIGTNDQAIFDDMLDKIAVDWDYLSYEDMDEEWADFDDE